ncbi:hypothetical protein IAR50_007597 [Cryptococcus sp. DSM 104548]
MSSAPPHCSFPPATLPPEVLDVIFNYYRASCSGSALISLISLSRDIYQRNIHKLYRNVTLHRDNASLFYRELFEPLDLIDVEENKEQWQRVAGMIKGGREPGMRLGPHVFRPGKSLLNKLCLYWEVNHISMAHLAALDHTDIAVRRLIPLVDLIRAASTGQANLLPISLHLFHYAVSVSYKWASIQPMCRSLEELSPSMHMGIQSFSYAWAGRPHMCLELPLAHEASTIYGPDLTTIVTMILQVSKTFTVHNCPPLDLSSYPASVNLDPRMLLPSVSFDLPVFKDRSVTHCLSSILSECVERSIEMQRSKVPPIDGHRFEFRDISEDDLSEIGPLLRPQDKTSMAGREAHKRDGGGQQTICVCGKKANDAGKVGV